MQVPGGDLGLTEKMLQKVLERTETFGEADPPWYHLSSTLPTFMRSSASFSLPS
jgi:hypothetical protein